MTDAEKKKLHLETITNHKAIVKKLCYMMGIPELGNKHDASKLYEDEFAIYKYATGKGSPHDVARAELGYSPSWCLHKDRNPHHWEYWLDSHDATPNGDGTYTMIVVPVKMPYKYVIEMFCDFVGAGQAYGKESWTVTTPINYWNTNCENKRAMHKDSEALIKKLLTTLSTCDSINQFVDWYDDNKKELEKKYNNV